jgi:hypothetical protein
MKTGLVVSVAAVLLVTAILVLRFKGAFGGSTNGGSYAGATKVRVPTYQDAGLMRAGQGSSTTMNLMDVIAAVQEKERRRGSDALAPHEKVVLDVDALEGEINNGGFHQYFFNSAGDRVAAAVDALKLIGALKAAAIVEDACRPFPDGRPDVDRFARQRQLQKIDDAVFKGLDERFYAYPDPIGELMVTYYRKHSADR